VAAIGGDGRRRQAGDRRIHWGQGEVEYDFVQLHYVSAIGV
jgi:hypothetical protein